LCEALGLAHRHRHRRAVSGAVALIEGDLRYSRSRALPFDRALLAARGLFPARRLPFRN
jgi:hypothetical protein